MTKVSESHFDINVNEFERAREEFELRGIAYALPTPGKLGVTP